VTLDILQYPPIDAPVPLLRRYFAAADDRGPLRNPHIEPGVSDSVRANAWPSAVLIPVVDYRSGARLLVTRRHRNIRFAGHVCFPGGRSDDADKDAIDTALRESGEEIGLSRSDVDVLGCLGDYYTQTGFRITPVVGIVEPPPDVAPNPAEVEEIYEISLARAFDSASYRFTRRNPDRGHWSFHEGDVRISGPTVSLMIGLYESLLAFAGVDPDR
jgi:8-oxo-dGTP pyrophosphatase MutT (NUDIX family)